jgi:hypothetical protein
VLTYRRQPPPVGAQLDDRLAAVDEPPPAPEAKVDTFLVTLQLPHSGHTTLARASDLLLITSSSNSLSHLSHWNS